MACGYESRAPEDYRTLFSVKKNQIQMMIDRGYDIEDEVNILGTTLENFKEFFQRMADDENTTVRELMTRDYIHIETGRKILVYYLKRPEDRDDRNKKSKEIIKTDMNDFTETYDQGGYHSYIIVASAKLNSGARDAVAAKKARPIEVFDDYDLTTNPINHVNVPVHEVLSVEQSRKLIRDNNWNVVSMPKLNPDDPIAKYYGIPKGSVVACHRSSPFDRNMVDHSIYYRVVASSKIDEAALGGDDAFDFEEED